MISVAFLAAFATYIAQHGGTARVYVKAYPNRPLGYVTFAQGEKLATFWLFAKNGHLYTNEGANNFAIPLAVDPQRAAEALERRAKSRVL